MSLRTRLVDVEHYILTMMNMLSRTDREYSSLREDTARLEGKLDILLKRDTPPDKCARCSFKRFTADAAAKGWAIYEKEKKRKRKFGRDRRKGERRGA